MYFQPRSEKVVSGVVLDARTEKPVAGAVIFLRELRRPFLLFPFALDSWTPIAKQVTDDKGAFRFDVCMTDWGVWLDWDDRGATRDPDWDENDAGAKVRLYSLTPPAGKAEGVLLLSDDVDSTMTELCKLF